MVPDHPWSIWQYCWWKRLPEETWVWWVPDNELLSTWFRARCNWKDDSSLDSMTSHTSRFGIERRFVRHKQTQSLKIAMVDDWGRSSGGLEPFTVLLSHRVVSSMIRYNSKLGITICLGWLTRVDVVSTYTSGSWSLWTLSWVLRLAGSCHAQRSYVANKFVTLIDAFFLVGELNF